MAEPATLDPVQSHRVSSFATTDEVRQYLQKHNLAESLHETLRLAKDELPSGSDLELSIRCDCETDDRWLVIHLSINAPRNRVYDIYDHFVGLWVESASRTAQHRMHFTYDSLVVESA